MRHTEAGVIQDIRGIPNGVRIVVQDYDMEGCDEDFIENGEGFAESVWE